MILVRMFRRRVDKGPYLVAGLGNPGKKYQKNRHNIGFQVVDDLAKQVDLTFSALQHGAFIARGSIAGQPIILAKPQKYMNKSGIPVAALVRFYRIPLSRLLVVYDDLDLPLGTIRLKPEGGSGGHNGMNSLVERLGTTDFARLRIGIGRPPGQMDPAKYVLRDFTNEQLTAVGEMTRAAGDAVLTWLEHGIDLAMSQHNGPASREN